jgi:hypothetical protein
VTAAAVITDPLVDAREGGVPFAAQLIEGVTAAEGRRDAAGGDQKQRDTGNAHGLLLE